MILQIQLNTHSRSRLIILAKKVRGHQINLNKEFQEILKEYSDDLFEAKERGLDKASDFLVEKLKGASPVRTGNLKKSWFRTTKYKAVRYVGNSAVGSKNKYGFDIPLTNLLEFSSKGKPFIRRTFEENKDKIIEIIKGEIEHGNSK